MRIAGPSGIANAARSEVERDAQVPADTGRVGVDVHAVATARHELLVVRAQQVASGELQRRLEPVPAKEVLETDDLIDDLKRALKAAEKAS